MILAVDVATVLREAISGELKSFILGVYGRLSCGGAKQLVAEKGGEWTIFIGYGPTGVLDRIHKAEYRPAAEGGGFNEKEVTQGAEWSIDPIAILTPKERADLRLMMFPELTGSEVPGA